MLKLLEERNTLMGKYTPKQQADILRVVELSFKIEAEKFERADKPAKELKIGPILTMQPRAHVQNLENS
jgi:hypothetical protein